MSEIYILQLLRYDIYESFEYLKMSEIHNITLLVFKICETLQKGYKHNEGTGWNNTPQSSYSSSNVKKMVC